jgi:hypothetical protein
MALYMSCFIVYFLTNKKLNKQPFELVQMLCTSCIYKKFILVSANYIVGIYMFCSSGYCCVFCTSRSFVKELLT